jgi:monosaccharide-transporting ATPase
MPVPLVEATGLEVRFGHRAVIAGVSLCVRAGEVHGLLGPHGAGKSVLLRTLAGELTPSRGTARADRAALVGDAAPLTVARALSSAVVLVDEPTAGFDADTRIAVRALALRHAARGGAVLWAGPRLDTFHRLASEVTLLAGGRVRYSGSVDALVLRSLAQPAGDVAGAVIRAA